MSLSGPHLRTYKYFLASAKIADILKCIYSKCKLTVALHHFKVVKFHPVLISDRCEKVSSFALPEYLIERSYYYEQIFLTGEGDRFPGTDR